jgi:hypothetical protein
MKISIPKLEETIHYLKVIKANYVFFQPEARESIDTSILLAENFLLAMKVQKENNRE